MDTMKQLLKFIKGIFFGLVALVLAVCIGILICALNPDLTEEVAQQVQALQDRFGFSWSGDGNSSSAVQPSGVLPEAVPGINPHWLRDRENRGYRIPGNAQNVVPPTVSGLTGYEPVSQEGQEVLPEEADYLGSNAVGETGENASFPEAYYPYYAMLDQDMKPLYHQIYANAAALTTSFAPVVDVDIDRLQRVFEAVYNDHPELFWLDCGYSCKYLADGRCVEITLRYNSTVNNLDTSRQQFLNRAETILTAARELGSDYEKEKYVHDALMTLVQYDVSAPLNQSAYSALVNGRTVCAGYARAFQYLMQQLEIPCYYCTGTAGEDHAWNIVQLANEYYNVDLTWDDTDPGTHDYFNRTDWDFANSHLRTGLSVYLPACKGTLYRGGVQIPVIEVIPGDASDESTATPTPLPPLSWDEYNEKNMTEEEKRKAELEKLGITEEELMETLEEYYDDCEAQLKTIGVGEGRFVNVVPTSLWSTVERSYSSGSYWDGYVTDALKALGVENFMIQLQVQDLNNGYTKVYHNVMTY